MKLNHDKLLSNLAFHCNLRHYIKVKYHTPLRGGVDAEWLVFDAGNQPKPRLDGVRSPTPAAHRLRWLLGRRSGDVAWADAAADSAAAAAAGDDSGGAAAEVLPWWALA